MERATGNLPRSQPVSVRTLDLDCRSCTSPKRWATTLRFPASQAEGRLRVLMLHWVWALGGELRSQVRHADPFPPAMQMGLGVKGLCWKAGMNRRRIHPSLHHPTSTQVIRSLPGLDAVVICKTVSNQPTPHIYKGHHLHRASSRNQRCL